jgi:hypothetical protein
MTTVTNAHGLTIDFDAAANLMDDDIVSDLGDGHMAGMTEQEAFNAYCVAHLEKFGEEFEPNKANPVW